MRVNQLACIPLLLLALATAGTAETTPETAPGGMTRVGSGLDSADAISWRKLRRSDFLGERPPGAFGTSNQRPVAVSCAYVVPSPEARIFPVPIPGAETDVAFRARIEGLRFRALLSRSCSWWNPDNTVSPAYVLQHEQIHFDLFEVTARRLNRDMPGLLQVMDVRGPSEEAVVNGAQRYVQNALSRALKQTGALNQKFDLETSFGIRHQRQDGWRMRLDRDLKALRPYLDAHISPPGTEP
jgi:hypothetical protein